MESLELDIKPIIPTNDIPDNSLPVGVNRFKQSRYEDVWPEDVHAAFMEAVALYPPMGKRRLKYYRVSTHENEHFSDANRAKSFGRCQLIQSYILEKTGKDRSRKQVSSHLQRLKKIHKDNPTMRSLFSEYSHPLLDHCSVPQAVPVPSQDISSNISFGTRYFKSEFGPIADVRNADPGTDRSPTFPCDQDVPSFDNGGPCNAVINLSTNPYSQPSVTPSQDLLSPQQSPASTFRPSDNDFLSEFQDPILLKDTINGGFRADSMFNASAFSISMRRLASRLPMQDQVDPYPTTHFSRAICPSALQPAYQWTSYDGLMNSTLPLTPARQWFHTPFHSPHLFPAEKLRVDPVFASEWMWPQNPDIGFGPRGSTFVEIPSRHPPTAYQLDSTLKANSPVFQSPQSESEGPQCPQGIFYSYTTTSPAVISGVSAESVIGVNGQALVSPENLSSPPVIRPTPIYPVSYIHTNDDADTPTTNLLP